MRQSEKDLIKTISSQPLCGENFKVGDQVTFTNDYGVKFYNRKIIGFSEPIYPGSGTVYISGDAYWFPNKPHQLTKTIEAA